MGIKRHVLVKTNKGLVGANGKQNKLDGVMFLDLTLGLTDLYRAGAPPKIYQ